MQTLEMTGVMTPEQSQQHLEAAVAGVVMALRHGRGLHEMVHEHSANGPEVVTALVGDHGFQSQEFSDLPAWALNHPGV